MITRYLVWYTTSKKFLETRFLVFFGPLALSGLLYTIVVMFAYQGLHIIQNIGHVFRVMVPLVLYFVTMWASAFFFVYYFGKRQRKVDGKHSGEFGYDMAVVQAFTAGSNNFVRTPSSLRV